MNTKTKKLMQSFIIVPLLATTMSINSFTASIDQAVLDAKNTVLTEAEITRNKEREINAAKIDAYYAKYGLPLEGYGMKMVLAAEEHNLDPFLIPAIAMRETTGGKFACYKNPFGWGSCKIKFENFDEAIVVVSRNLGGGNPKTAHYYKGKSVKGILETYNPPSIVPTYAGEVMSIMKKIDSMPVSQ